MAWWPRCSAAGDPEQMGYVEHRCQQCGQGKHLVSMSCKPSLCLRCAKVLVDNWLSQVSKVLHEGVIYRHIILTVPAMFHPIFYQNAAELVNALTSGKWPSFCQTRALVRMC